MVSMFPPSESAHDGGCVFAYQHCHFSHKFRNFNQHAECWALRLATSRWGRSLVESQTTLGLTRSSAKAMRWTSGQSSTPWPCANLRKFSRNASRFSTFFCCNKTNGKIYVFSTYFPTIRDCPHETEALEDCGGNEGAGVICYKKGLKKKSKQLENTLFIYFGQFVFKTYD